MTSPTNEGNTKIVFTSPKNTSVTGNIDDKAS